MERNRTINLGNLAIIEQTLCAVCNRSVRAPCPHCTERRYAEPCWFMLDHTNGFRHRHCSVNGKDSKNKPEAKSEKSTATDKMKH